MVVVTQSGAAGAGSGELLGQVSGASAVAQSGQIGMQCGGEAGRGGAAGDSGGLGAGGHAGGQALGKGQAAGVALHAGQCLQQGWAQRVVQRRDPGPEVAADGVIAARVAVLGVGDPVPAQGGGVLHHPGGPVGGEALRCHAGQCAHRLFGQHRPWPGWIGAGQPPQQVQRGVARVEAPLQAVFADETLRAGQQHGAQPRHFGDFLGADACQQRPAFRGQGGRTPEAGRFDQCPGEPEIGIAGSVGVEHAPAAIALAAPLPGGQACSQVTGAEVLAGPVQHLVEARAIVGHQREEQPVGLAFRGTDTGFGVGVEHAAIGLQECLDEAGPQRVEVVAGQSCRCRPGGTGRAGERTHPAGQCTQPQQHLPALRVARGARGIRSTHRHGGAWHGAAAAHRSLRTAPGCPASAPPTAGSAGPTASSGSSSARAGRRWCKSHRRCRR